MMADRIYTEEAIRAHLADSKRKNPTSISHSTFHEWRKLGGLFQFFEVGSHGSNHGKAIFSEVGSLDHFDAVIYPKHRETVAETNRENARGRILHKFTL
jgi:hypothetical protein